MVLNLYETLLDELSQALRIEPLEPDENNTCLLKFSNDQEVYVEMLKEDQQLLLGSTLGEVPLGRYRENLFKAALAANALPYPRFGTFAYSININNLVLFELLPTKNLTGQKIADYIAPFVQTAKAWSEAIEKGEVPHVTTPESSEPPPSGMLGLR